MLHKIDCKKDDTGTQACSGLQTGQHEVKKISNIMYPESRTITSSLDLEDCQANTIRTITSSLDLEDCQATTMTTGNTLSQLYTDMEQLLEKES